ncbi:MAG: hypothetical protein IJB52_13695 [Clostridia bacterium]|nr:hypothetical protein [Clostridia bacterium]
MKKFLVMVMTVVMIATLAVAAMAETIEFDYVRYTAAGNDPYGSFEFGAIDRAVTKWAVIKYRTVTEKDSTGAAIRGQLYAKGAEPHVLINWNHTQQWETIVLDLTSTFDNGATPEIWTTTTETTFRFDMMESNRDAVANDSADPAVIEEGAQIDIAYIAFYNSEADAKAETNAVVTLGADELAIESDRFTAEVLTEVIELPDPEPETEAETVAEVVEAPAAPQTFDAGIIAAVAAVVAAAGYAVSKKR